MRTFKRRLVGLLLAFATLAGVGIVEIADAAPAAAQSCSWQNFWVSGGSPGVSYNISYSTCPGGSHQVVADYHLNGVLRQDLGGFNFWVVWSVGLPHYMAGGNGFSSYIHLCVNGGGFNNPCWAGHGLANLSLGPPNGWEEKLPNGNYSQYGQSTEWGAVTDAGRHYEPGNYHAIMRLS